MERITSGGGTILIGEAQEEFQAGDIIVIPQHIVHKFSYNPDAYNAWLSVKFTVESSEKLSFTGAVIRNHAVLEPLFEAVSAALTPAILHNEAVAEVVDSMLVSAVRCLELDERGSNPTHLPLIQKVIQYIYDQQGRYISVAELGDVFGYSCKYLSSRFLQETGKQLKTFIDTQRCEYAVGLLQTSTESLSEIAAELDFPDVFAFSRFFKRNFGENLSAFRKRKVHDK